MGRIFLTFRQTVKSEIQRLRKFLLEFLREEDREALNRIFNYALDVLHVILYGFLYPFESERRMMLVP